MPVISTPPIRPASIEDAPALAALYAERFAGAAGRFPESALAATPDGVALMLQTGHAFFAAVVAPGDADDGMSNGMSNGMSDSTGDTLTGAVRYREDEGIVTFDLLASRRPWAGRALARRVDQFAQDRGVRLVRTRVPEDGALPELFARWGYLPIARRPATAGGTDLELEKRVPLLTVREQRRSDAAEITALAGVDAWPFEQGARPGWFVLADGERVAGVISVGDAGRISGNAAGNSADRDTGRGPGRGPGRDAGTGLAAISAPVVREAYLGRGLEVWMLERAALHAETNGYHSARVVATPALARHERDLEDRRWFREGDAFVRRFRDLSPAGDEDGDKFNDARDGGRDHGRDRGHDIFDGERDTERDTEREAGW